MGRKFQYTTLDRVLSKIYRDLGLEEISETDVIEWSGEALEAIGAITMYEEAVAFIEIENHQGDLPNGLHSIIQVARNNRWESHSKQDCICPANVQLDCTIEEIQSNSPTCGCNKPDTEIKHTKQGDAYFFNGQEYVFMDCNGHLIGDYDVAYYRPYFDLQYEYYGWRNSNLYRQAYTPVRLANHTFFNTLVCEEDKADGLYSTCTDEYTIVGDKIRTSFKEGSVAISYTRQKIDPETGYPMIPDDYSVITAITMYITMKYMGRMWYLGREGYADKYQKSEQDWHWYCKQAGNRMLLPYGIDEHENLKDMRYQLIPKQNRYYGFFGKMSRPQNMSAVTNPNRNFNLRGI